MAWRCRAHRQPTHFQPPFPSPFHLQGDRKAGPGNLGFNYESRAGQQALRTMYSVILQQSHKPDLLPETCREGGCQGGVRAGDVGW